MEKTTQSFQTALADLYAEGLFAQAVNDMLTVYVGAASQHVLRYDFFGFTSFNATSLLRCFFYLSNLEGLVWALQFSGMLLLYGVFGSRSFPRKWQQPSHWTQTLSSMSTTTQRPISTTPHPHSLQMNNVFSY